MGIASPHPQFNLTLTGTRSIAWKLALGLLTPGHTVTQWYQSLAEQRLHYAAARQKHMREITAVGVWAGCKA